MSKLARLYGYVVCCGMCSVCMYKNECQEYIHF